MHASLTERVLHCLKTVQTRWETRWGGRGGGGEIGTLPVWLSNVLYQGNKNRTKKGRKSATVRLSLLRTGAHSLQLICCLFIISFVMYWYVARLGGADCNVFRV